MIPSSRALLYLLLAAYLLPAGLGGCDDRSPLDEEVARTIAKEKFPEFAKEFDFDWRLFDGPKQKAVVRDSRAFQWVYRDAEGTIEVLIWVNGDGWTELVLDESIERVRSAPD